MTNRTIQFWGQGYAPTGTDPITITATLDGNQIYSGPISTLYTTDVSRLPTDQVLLFTCELPVSYSGTIPMSIVIDSPVNSDVFFEQIYANYVQIQNPVYTQAEVDVLVNPASTQAERIAIYQAKAVPPLDAAEIAILNTGTPEEKTAILNSHNLAIYISGGADTFGDILSGNDPRSNVVINGTAITRGSSPIGTWGWEVELSPDIANDGTITYDLTVQAGVE